MNGTELLAPAGDYECFLAAVNAGADAVYLGGNYSARAYAKNFTDEEILRAIDHAHLYGRKVYMTLNILLKDKEIGGITSYLRPFYLAGLDGVIVQDIGLFGLLRKAMPDLPLHASTQMAITDIAGVELLSKLGAKRVVLARELSLDEIQNIRERSDMPLECFIHGALCYSYSGKCLMSSMLGDRSGNRGRCAQPCRLPYDGEYLLSCRDICTLELLPSLIEAGIASFKIEGRMKSPDYVTLVTSVYRKHMDLYKADPAGYTVDGEDLKRLQELYGRCGHSSGYYMQHNGRNMITVKKPGYEKGDAKDRQMMNGLFRNDPTPLPVDLSATFRQGEAVRVTAESHDVSVTVTGPVAETAKTRGLGIDEIKKQFGKMGGTPFYLRDLKIEGKDPVFLPVSSLNAMRRELTGALSEKILQGFRREEAGIFAVPKDDREPDPEVPYTHPDLHVQVTNLAQAKAAFASDEVGILSVPYDLFLQNEKEIREIHLKRKGSGHPLLLYLQLSNICRNNYFETGGRIAGLIADPVFDGILIDNYESLQYLRENGYDREILADLHLYALNAYAHSVLSEYGVTRFTVPVELNRAELSARGMTGEDLIVYGRLPLMVSAQCIKKTKDKCTKRYETVSIGDRYHVDFPVLCKCSDCYNVICNSVPVSLHDETALMRKIKPASLRLLFTTETGEDTAERIRYYAALIKGLDLDKPDYPYTKGHLSRGVQ